MTDRPAERDPILGRLSAQRQHVLAQLDGLDDEQLRRPVLPSGWSCLELVRHLTLSDERYWFEVVVAGGALDFWPEDDHGDWSVGPEESADDVIRDYRSAIAASDAIVATRSLDDAPASPEDWWAEVGMSFPDLRTVVLHVLVETSVHAGQLDAVREIIDGRQYIVL